MGITVSFCGEIVEYMIYYKKSRKVIRIKAMQALRIELGDSFIKNERGDFIECAIRH